MTDQPKFSNIVKVPDYFANYCDIGDELAAFLGGSIVAKVSWLWTTLLFSVLIP